MLRFEVAVSSTTFPDLYLTSPPISCRELLLLFPASRMTTNQPQDSKVDYDAKGEDGEFVHFEQQRAELAAAKVLEGGDSSWKVLLKNKRVLMIILAVQVRLSLSLPFLCDSGC